MSRLFSLSLGPLVGLAVGFFFFILPMVFDGSQKIPEDPTGVAVSKMISAAVDNRAKMLFPYRLENTESKLTLAKNLMSFNLGYGFCIWGLRDFEHSQEAMDDAYSSACKLFMACNTHQIEAERFATTAINNSVIALNTSRALNQNSLPSVSTRSNLAEAEMCIVYARAKYANRFYDEAIVEANASKLKSETASEENRRLLSRFSDRHYLTVWHSWIDSAIKNSKKTGSVLFIVIKQPHVLRVYRAGELVLTVKVDLGANWIYPKLHEGDRCTPEGKYKISMKNPNSKYYMALLIDYPNAEDRKRYKRAKHFGEIPKDVGVGGMIEIHGNGGLGYDWTDGCIGPNDNDMKVLYDISRVGGEVIIVGNV
jgi:murein L,D-transpeptidase YafK